MRAETKTPPRSGASQLKERPPPRPQDAGTGVNFSTSFVLTSTLTSALLASARASCSAASGMPSATWITTEFVRGSIEVWI